MLKKNEAVRNRFAVIMAIVILLASCLSLFVLTTNRYSASAVADQPSVSLNSGLKSVMSTDLRGGENFVSQSVTAVITPNNVTDKYVTWSLAWASDAPLKNTDISEYLRLTDESQGSLTATINCYKAFRNSKAILTCTTRQGNKSTSCEIVYEGAPSAMNLTKQEGIERYNLGNKTVDLLYIDTDYEFRVLTDNIFHDAGTTFDDYVVSISGVGTVTCGTYTVSPRGAGWTAHNTVVNFANVASDLITTNVNGRVITVTPNKNFYEYYESEHSQYVEGNGQTTTYTNKLYSLNVDDDGNLPYFIMTVSHRTLNFSQQYQFYISESINSVSLNPPRITF